MTRTWRFLFSAPLCCLCAALFLALVSLPAQAAPEGAAAPQDRFDAMDANKDGKVDLKEFLGSFTNMKEEAFTSIDTNKDKGIDRAEWSEFAKGHAAGMRSSMGQGSGMPLVTPPAQ